MLWGRSSSSRKNQVPAVAQYLRGMSYPATKDDVINTARENHAPSRILHSLDRVPEKEYASLNEVAEAAK